jgi:hypothetical protein
MLETLLDIRLWRLLLPEIEGCAVKFIQRHLSRLVDASLADRA